MCLAYGLVHTDILIEQLSEASGTNESLLFVKSQLRVFKYKKPRESVLRSKPISAAEK